MKIFVHSYQLHAQEQTREGALLRVEWSPKSFGYSDLHPWPEFGDETLETQIGYLAESQMTSLLKRSLELNSVDHGFRSVNRSAFLGLSLPSVHKLMRSVSECEGFTHVKLKMGKNLELETKTLSTLAQGTDFKLRLDFNNRLTAAKFTAWWNQLSPELHARVDFVEDPGELTFAGPWASDWTEVPFAQVKIVKPAREDVSVAEGFKRVVFTHSLDHTLGMASSLWAAANYYREHPAKLEVCGLGAADYEPDEFSREWSCAGPRMKPPQGTGFGFDKILSGLKWDRVL